MTQGNFEDWFSTFRESINDIEQCIDFRKIYSDIESIDIEISILNTLIGAENIEEKFRFIMKKYPECIKAIPILLAVRESKIYCQDENGAFDYDFEKINYSAEQ